MPNSVVHVTLRELQAAAAWAETHAREVHAGVMPYADLAIRSLEGTSVGVRTIVSCEVCDRTQVANANHHDVTDYDAW